MGEQREKIAEKRAANALELKSKKPCGSFKCVATSYLGDLLRRTYVHVSVREPQIC
jgi:hypothetical protein